MFLSKNTRAASLITGQGRPMEENVDVDDGGERRCFVSFLMRS